MSRRTGSRARLKDARRRAKNPDVKKKKPTERTSAPMQFPSDLTPKRS
jgi:hypothetical protein